MSETSAYARAFAGFLGLAHAFPFWKGRVALYAVLRALGIGRGDEVILPGYTCVMNVNPVMYVGAVPIYVDIEPRTFNLDPEAVAAAITPRTRLIIAQHTYGYPANLQAIQELADARGIVVIEDCCLALGSTYKGRMVGTLGRAAYFSFQWSKPYTTGLGGMAVTGDATLADSISQLCRQELRRPASSATLRLSLQYMAYRTLVRPSTIAKATRAFRWLTHRGLVVGSSDQSEYDPAMPEGFFTGMSDRQMCWGQRQLRRIQANVDHRRSTAQLYDRLLVEAGWPARPVPPESDPVLVRYPLRVANKRELLTEALRHNLEIGSWFESPLHPEETPLLKYHYQPGQCPVAERACREVVNLPLHPNVNASTVGRIVAFIRKSASLS